MIMKIYSIYDEKAKAYLPPFFLNNDEVAMRAVENCLDTPDHQFAKHPQDYTLYYIGEWDDNSANINSEFELICPLIALKTTTPELKEVKTS